MKLAHIGPIINKCFEALWNAGELSGRRIGGDDDSISFQCVPYLQTYQVNPDWQAVRMMEDG